MTDPIPLRGDRAAHDDVHYPHLHARDLDNGMPIHHLPSGAQKDQVPQWDGEKWIPVDPPGGGGGDPMWYIAGRLAAAENVSAGILITRECLVEAVYVYAKMPGSAGATTIDINLNGVSIFEAGQEPSLSYGDPDHYVKSTLATPLALVEGNVLSLDIDAAATGAADLSVILALSSSGSSGTSTGGTGDMTRAVYDTNNDGAVNNAEALDGHPPSDFAAADHTHPGMGDMLRLAYDADSDGYVDNANNSEQLEGHPASYFATADHTHEGGSGGDRYAQSIHTIEGTNLLETGVKPIRFYLYLPASGATLREILCTVNTPPGSALRIDVHKNGTSILGGAGYVEIGAGNNTGTISTFTSSVLSNNDYFQIEIVQGDATAADLSVHVRYTY